MTDAMKIEYVVLIPDDVADMTDFLAKHFYPRENLCVGAGLVPVDPTVGLECQCIQSCLASGLSVAARDTTTKRLMGVLLSRVLTSPPELTEATYGSDPLAKFYAILGMFWKILDVFQDPGVELVLHIERVCVHPDYGRRGVLKGMMTMCTDLGSKQGCQLARIGATSPYTEKASLRLGFESRATIDLNTLEKGMLDLSLMTIQEIKFFTKLLTAKTPVPEASPSD